MADDINSLGKRYTWVESDPLMRHPTGNFPEREHQIFATNTCHYRLHLWNVIWVPPKSTQVNT